MKHSLTLLCCLAATFFAHAQNAPRTGISLIGADSVNITMNDGYNLVNDSCATIVRHGHYNFSTHKFFGKFTDVSKANPSRVMAEGNYTADGLKDGEFTNYYANGRIQSKGTYKNNNYAGKWVVNYRSGNPEMIFEMTDAGELKVTDLWDNKGVKLVDNGNGDYHVNMGSIVWQGKLNDGLPDGTWTAASRNDLHNILITENFKKGKFQKGKSPAGSYTDASRIVLVDPNMLPYSVAEQLTVSTGGCNVVKPQRIVNAKFIISAADFNEQFKEIMAPYIAKVDVKNYEDDVVFEGTISSEGIFGGFRCTTLFDYNATRNIIDGLIRLPKLQPATVNGKPVAQGFRVTFSFRQGLHHFSYKFMPIEAPQ